MDAESRTGVQGLTGNTEIVETKRQMLILRAALNYELALLEAGVVLQVGVRDLLYAGLYPTLESGAQGKNTTPT